MIFISVLVIIPCQGFVFVRLFPFPLFPYFPKLSNLLENLPDFCILSGYPKLEFQYIGIEKEKRIKMIV